MKVIYVATIQNSHGNNLEDSDIEKYREEFTQLKPELRDLQNQGYIKEDIDNERYFIPSQIILEWIIEKSREFQQEE